MIDAVLIFAGPALARVPRCPTMIEMASASPAGIAICSFDGIKGVQA
jgi:hypothetical protein